MGKWEMVRLFEIFELQMGKTPSRSNSSYWADGRNKWISIADLSNAGKYIRKTKECITDKAVFESGIKLVPAKTVIMSFKLSLGKTCITEESIYTNEAIMAFIDKGKFEINNDYIYHLFKGKDWSVGTNKAVMGATLNKATLSMFEIPLPPLEVQRKIAETLDAASELLAMRKNQLAELDKLIQSVFYDMFGDPVVNEKGWEIKPISSFATVRIGPFGSLLHVEDYIEDGIPLINPSHIIDGKVVPDKKLTISSEKFTDLQSYAMQKGDVVLGRRGEIGRCAVVENDVLLCGTGSMFIHIENNYLPMVLQKIISSDTMKAILLHQSVGVTMQNLNSGTISKLKVPIIPINHQTKFASTVQKIEEQKALVKKAIDETQALFDSLMNGYFE